MLCARRPQLIGRRMRSGHGISNQANMTAMLQADPLQLLLSPSRLAFKRGQDVAFMSLVEELTGQRA